MTENHLKKKKRRNFFQLNVTEMKFAILMRQHVGDLIQIAPPPPIRGNLCLAQTYMTELFQC